MSKNCTAVPAATDARSPAGRMSRKYRAEVHGCGAAANAKRVDARQINEPGCEQEWSEQRSC
jgi:hypothetical protein